MRLVRRKILFKCIFHPKESNRSGSPLCGFFDQFWPRFKRSTNHPKKTIFIQYFTVLILFFVFAIVGNDVHVVATCCCYCCLLCCCIKTVSFSSGRCRPTVLWQLRWRTNTKTTATSAGRSVGRMDGPTNRSTDRRTYGRWIPMCVSQTICDFCRF